MQLTPLKKEDITPEHKNKPVLYVNKGYKEYGVLSHRDKDGVHVHFAMNDELLIMNTGEMYLVELD